MQQPLPREVTQDIAFYLLASTEIATCVTHTGLDAGLEEPTAAAPEEFASYASFTSGARQGDVADVDPVMPALRNFPGTAAT